MATKSSTDNQKAKLIRDWEQETGQSIHSQMGQDYLRSQGFKTQSDSQAFSQGPSDSSAWVPYVDNLQIAELASFIKSSGIQVNDDQIASLSAEIISAYPDQWATNPDEVVNNIVVPRLQSLELDQQIKDGKNEVYNNVYQQLRRSGIQIHDYQIHNLASQAAGYFSQNPDANPKEYIDHVIAPQAEYLQNLNQLHSDYRNTLVDQIKSSGIQLTDDQIDQLANRIVSKMAANPSSKPEDVIDSLLSDSISTPPANPKSPSTTSTPISDTNNSWEDVSKKTIDALKQSPQYANKSDAFLSRMVDGSIASVKKEIQKNAPQNTAQTEQEFLQYYSKYFEDVYPHLSDTQKAELFDIGLKNTLLYEMAGKGRVALEQEINATKFSSLRPDIQHNFQVGVSGYLQTHTANLSASDLRELSNDLRDLKVTHLQAKAPEFDKLLEPIVAKIETRSKKTFSGYDLSRFLADFDVHATGDKLVHQTLTTQFMTSGLAPASASRLAGVFMSHNLHQFTQDLASHASKDDLSLDQNKQLKITAFKNLFSERGLEYLFQEDRDKASAQTLIQASNRYDYELLYQTIATHTPTDSNLYTPSIGGPPQFIRYLFDNPVADRFKNEAGKIALQKFLGSGVGKQVAGQLAKAGINIGIKAATTTATTAAASAATGGASGAAAGAAAGSVVPIIGTIIGAIVGFLGSMALAVGFEKVKKNASEVSQATLAAFFSGGAALGQAMGGIFAIATSVVYGTAKSLVALLLFLAIGLPILIAIFLFIINSSSYMLPPGLTSISGGGLGDIVLGGPCQASPSFDQYIPNPAPIPLPAGYASFLSNRLANITNPSNSAAYAAAAAVTGVPCEILAAIHVAESGARPNTSLRSGRGIGYVETDICGLNLSPAQRLTQCSTGTVCSSQRARWDLAALDDPIGGTPVYNGGGCVFDSVADSAVNTAEQLLSRYNIGTTYESLIGGLSRYNGGGNANCDNDGSSRTYVANDGNTYSVPYTGCPRLFFGEDDPYAMNMLDERHANMYLIYCGDGTRCAPQDMPSGGLMRNRGPLTYSVAYFFNYFLRNNPNP